MFALPNGVLTALMPAVLSPGLPMKRAIAILTLAFAIFAAVGAPSFLGVSAAYAADDCNGCKK